MAFIFDPSIVHLDVLGINGHLLVHDAWNHAARRAGQLDLAGLHVVAHLPRVGGGASVGVPQADGAGEQRLTNLSEPSVQRGIEGACTSLHASPAASLRSRGTRRRR